MPSCSTTSEATTSGEAWKVIACVSPSRNSCTGSQSAMVRHAPTCTSGLEFSLQTAQRPETGAGVGTASRHEK